MAVLGLLLLTLARVIKLVLDIYTFLILGAALISWLRPDPYNPVVRFIRQTTEPAFAAIRKKLPPAWFRTGLDVTPLVVLVLLIVADTLVVGLLTDAGLRLRSGYIAPSPVFERNIPAQKTDLPQL